MSEISIKPKRLYDSDVENLSYDILKELINLEHYEIVPHVILRDILPPQQDSTWGNFHIDFVICDKRGYPVMGMEINGPKHWNDSCRKEHDQIKKQIFTKAQIPLIFIPIVELPQYNHLDIGKQYRLALQSLLINCLSPYIYATAFPAYCWKCGGILDIKFNNDNFAPFYICSNKDCECYKNNKTFPAEISHPILSEAALKFFKKT
ncbi:MAG: DUF2726 domain-containing protein [Clostridiales bacterium]|nr:DUF2726 domain-containing protein [Clostridiales bacterium]